MTLKGKIILGLRPTFSAQCPARLVQLARECWHSEARLRPSLSHIIKTLDELLCDLVSQLT